MNSKEITAIMQVWEHVKVEGGEVEVRIGGYLAATVMPRCIAFESTLVDSSY